MVSGLQRACLVDHRFYNDFLKQNGHSKFALSV